MDVDSVEDGSGQSRQVSSSSVGRAHTRRISNACVPARAGVCRENQLDARGESCAVIRAMDDDVARLEWLPQRIENRGGELGGLVQKEHTTTRSRHRTGANHPRPTSHDRNGRRRVMRCDERRSGHQLARLSDTG